VNKVLIISYYWPPSGGAGVQRWLKFVKYLREFGWEPIVYTAENAEYPVLDHSLEKDIPEGVEVWQQPIKEPYHYYKALLGQKKTERVYSGFLQERGKRNWKQKLSLFIRANVFIPDARCMWISPSARYLIKKIRQEKIDLIISTGPPHSMHLIAQKVKKAVNIPWLADFRDPWTNIDFADDLPFTKYALRKNERLEKKVLIDADAVVVVSELMKEEFETKSGREVQLITNGFDPDDFNADKSTSIKDETTFSIVHTGSLNNRRNHIALWNAIAELKTEAPKLYEKIQIQLIGKTDVDARNDIEKSGLQEITSFIEYMPHQEVSSIQLKADILLLLINRFGDGGDRFKSSKGTLTGKMFEYLACEIPILAIGNTDSHLARILQETQAGEVCDFDDKQAIKNFIIRTYEGKNQVKKSDLINKYSRKELTAKMAELMNEVIHKQL
jgi:glycosyltransferase involved in cell wall biosynthesis